MISKIVCMHCGDVLRKGDIGAKVEKKICTSCVIKTSPASDPKKIKRVVNEIVTPTNYSAQIELENLRKRISKIHIELPYKKIDNEWCLCIELKDNEGNKFAEIGFSRDKLAEFIGNIEDIEDKEGV